MEMPLPKQWEPRAAIPVLAGLYWMIGSQEGGWLLWGLVPGVLMLASGVALLLWAGDRRITEYMAAGGLLGVVVAPLALFSGGFGEVLTGALLAAAAYLTAGRVALSGDPVPVGAPAPAATLPVDAKAALDEALLAYFVGTANIPSGARARRACEQAAALEEALRSHGLLEHPEPLHPAPKAPGDVHVRESRLYGHEYEQISFASEFQPDARLPGADAWGRHRDNRRAVARVLRHPGPPRPWLMCVHGYRMGEAWLDFLLFPPAWLHERLGLNLVMPVLPLHGPRRSGWRSGDDFLDGDPLDLLFAQAQALWDLRRTVAWLRAQEPEARIGVLGYSLGGYNTALLTQYERDLEFAVAGIPVVDFAAALWRHLPPQHQAFYSEHGLTRERYDTVLRPVSPLALPPLLERDRRYIFGGAADRVVQPEQVLRLAEHWGVPVQWYPGGHLTFRGEAVVQTHVEAAMARAGWPVPERPTEPRPQEGAG